MANAAVQQDPGKRADQKHLCHFSEHTINTVLSLSAGQVNFYGAPGLPPETEVACFRLALDPRIEYQRAN